MERNEGDTKRCDGLRRVHLVFIGLFSVPSDRRKSGAESFLALLSGRDM
jgi:hypothetical protein